MQTDGKKPDNRKSAGIEIGRCDWGWESDLFPELRLGWVRFWWCRGSAAEMLRELPRLRDALKQAISELGKKP